MCLRIKFFVMPYFHPDNYSPEIIALGEGLKNRDVEIFSNVNYWFVPEDNSYLFSTKDSKEYDIGIYDYKYLFHSKRWTLNAIDKSKVNVLIDRNDWLDQEWNDPKVIHSFDLILVDHMIKGFAYPKNVKPWSIGVTNRIMNYINKSSIDDKQIRQKRILSNSRVPHNLRKAIQSGLNKKLNNGFTLSSVFTKNMKEMGDDPHITVNDKHYATSTAGRHNPMYYQLINEYLITNAVGGYYEYKPVFRTPYSLFKKLQRKPYALLNPILEKTNMDMRKTVFIFQYDSFRFWEIMYSHSCVLSMDFEYWGFQLPINPVEGEHYIGVTDLQCKSVTERLSALSVEEIRNISENGRLWCEQNYSPNAVTERLFKMLGFELPAIEATSLKENQFRIAQ